MTGSATSWLVLQPHDTVHVRDGRSFVGGEGGRAEVARPTPSTIAGAIGAACRAAGATTLPRAVRGPILTHWDEDDGWTGYLPTPNDVMREPDEFDTFHRLTRIETKVQSDLTWGSALTEAMELLGPKNSSVDLEPPGGFVSLKNLGDYLREPGSDDPTFTDYVEFDPLRREPRTGVRLDQGKTAVPGQLYSIVHWRLVDGWAFAAQCEGLPCSDSELPASIGFGGASRLADVTATGTLRWPEPPSEFPGGRLLLYLATPAVWSQGWIPPLGDHIRIRAAALGSPEPFSTATPGGGDFQGSSMRFTMVPAGSVYYLEFPSPASAAEWAQRYHGRALGPAPRPNPNRPPLDTAGFGVVLTGVWQ